MELVSLETLEVRTWHPFISNVLGVLKINFALAQYSWPNEPSRPNHCYIWLHAQWKGKHFVNSKMKLLFLQNRMHCNCGGKKLETGGGAIMIYLFIFYEAVALIYVLCQYVAYILYLLLIHGLCRFLDTKWWIKISI